MLLRGLPGALTVFVAPLTLAIGVLTAGVLRLLRWRWWAALAVTAAGVAWTAVVGLDAAWTAYVAVLGEMWAAATRQGGVAVGEWIAGMMPLSLAAGGIVAAGLRLYAHIRRPAYREPLTRVKPRKLSRHDSAIAAGKADRPGAIALGRGSNGEIVHVSLEELSVHGLLTGGTGSGKTTAMRQLLRGLTGPQAGGVIYVDLKGSPELIDQLRDLADHSGRQFRLWSMAGPTVWNPVARGDATEQRDKLMMTLGPYSQEFYEQAAKRYLQTILNVLHHPMLGPEGPITLQHVDRLLDVSRLSREVLGDPLPNGRTTSLLGNHDPLLDEVEDLVADYTGDKELRSAVTGWRTRLATLLHSTAGRWIAGPGDIDLYEALAAGDIVLMSLDSSRYQDAAVGIARAIVRDLVTVAAEIQRTPPLGHQSIRGTVVLDEFSAAAGDDLLALFARGRSAGITTWLVTQELADLELASPTFARQVLANTNVKLIGRTDVAESAETIAAAIGTAEVWEETVQVMTDAAHLREQRGGATGMGSLRQVDKFRIHPNTLKELRRGQAVLLVKHPQWRLDTVTVIPTHHSSSASRAPATQPA